MAKKIFTDNPHRNTIVRKDDKDWLFKSVDDKSVQHTEYLVQKYLYESQCVPFCFDYSDSGFLEEFISGKTFNELTSFSEEEIISIAKSLAKIHAIEPNEKMLKIFDNLIYKDLKYSPIKVYELIVGELEEWLKDYVDVEKLKDAIRVLERELENIEYKLSIVHGDLSGNNIFLTDEGLVKFIDWTDCRIDIGLSDVIQFFFLTDLEEKYQNVFLREYDSPLGFEGILNIQRIFFELYSFIYEYKKNSEISKKYLTRTNLLVERLRN